MTWTPEIQINIDCHDLDGMVAFYTAAFGYKPHGRAGEQYASILPESGSGNKIVFQKVPESKAVKNRVHLDFIVGDANVESEAARCESLGATRVERIEEHGGRWIVMLDPEGNEFCLCDC